MFANGVITSRIAGNQKDLVIPKTAVLWTGKRAVVYVKSPGRDQPTFQYREITLGPAAGDFYVVAEGLNEGEEIAVNGVFKIDAAAQLAGKSSMMNMAQRANMEEVKIASPVVCGICKETIEKGLMKERGVKHVNVDLDTKLVTVTFNSSQISTGAIRRAISMLGYDADEVPADKSVYENLPACCKEQ